MESIVRKCRLAGAFAVVYRCLVRSKRRCSGLSQILGSLHIGHLTTKSAFRYTFLASTICHRKSLLYNQDISDTYHPTIAFTDQYKDPVHIFYHLLIFWKIPNNFCSCHHLKVFQGLHNPLVCIADRLRMPGCMVGTIGMCHPQAISKWGCKHLVSRSFH